jgi:hypothetical protein
MGRTSELARDSLSQDATTSPDNEFDLYDVDANGLKPLRNVMQTSKFRLEITFNQDVATLRRIAENGGTTLERIPLTMPVMPEGPGERVFMASLPLGKDFKTEYYILDRWSGTGTSRLKLVTLSVIGTKEIATAIGNRDVFELEVTANDGSFRIVEYVRTLPPYYPFRVEYVRGSRKIISEVTSMILGPEG